jgi:hypothetical protein
VAGAVVAGADSGGPSLARTRPALVHSIAAAHNSAKASKKRCFARLANDSMPPSSLIPQ